MYSFFPDGVKVLELIRFFFSERALDLFTESVGVLD